MMQSTTEICVHDISLDGKIQGFLSLTDGGTQSPPGYQCGEARKQYKNDTTLNFIKNTHVYYASFKAVEILTKRNTELSRECHSVFFITFYREIHLLTLI